MNGVTIDNLDIKSHRRYAEDQLKLDPTYITECNTIPPHSEILGTSSIYASCLEQLFELDKSNHPWAFFCPPQKYNVQANRFFSYSIIPSIAWDSAEEEEEQEEEDAEDLDTEEFEILRKALAAVKAPQHSYGIFENERSAVLNLLDSISMLNQLLRQINSRKVQYQKG